MKLLTSLLPAFSLLLLPTFSSSTTSAAAPQRRQWSTAPRPPPPPPPPPPPTPPWTPDRDGGQNFNGHVVVFRDYDGSFGILRVHVRAALRMPPAALMAVRADRSGQAGVELAFRFTWSVLQWVRRTGDLRLYVAGTTHEPYFERRPADGGDEREVFGAEYRVIIEDNDDAERYVNAILDYFSAERPFTNLRDGDELYDENYPQALRQQGD